MTTPPATPLAALGGFEEVPPAEQLARAKAFFDRMRRRRTIRDFSARGGAEAGRNRKNYSMPESVGIARGFLLAALHSAGLATLTHTPNPMGFLAETLGRRATEKAVMLIVVGKPARDATAPDHALKKKALSEIMTVF